MVNILQQVKANKPLVHHITNYVTVNDCANITLAIGASPIMADAIEEVADITAISQALVLNIGTLNERTIASMLVAGKTANNKGIPVILDAVGAGASKLRNDTTLRLIKEIKLSILRGNISEIRFIAGLHSQTNGVDAHALDISATDSVIDIAKEVSKKYSCVVVISGAKDVVSAGEKVCCIENGNVMLGSLTGTGCMSASLLGALCGTVPNNPYQAAICATLCMGISGEIAYEKTKELGNGSFRVALHDAMSQLNDITIERLGRYYEIEY
jgi:hydroxyethylthiazole kinase